MKIVGESILTGKGHVILTDEPFTPRVFKEAASKKRILVQIDGRRIELEITSVEISLHPGGKEFLAFILPPISDSVRRSLLNQEIELT